MKGMEWFLELSIEALLRMIQKNLQNDTGWRG